MHSLFHEVALAQLNLKQGIKRWGEKGIQAVVKELRQLHDQKVGSPRHRMDLSPKERRAALKYLMFLKQKKSGDIKGRGCADGRK